MAYRVALLEFTAPRPCVTCWSGACHGRARFTVLCACPYCSHTARPRCLTPLHAPWATCRAAAADTCRYLFCSATTGGPSPRLARLSEASALSPSASGPWRPWEAAEEAQHRGGGGGGGGGAAADPWVDRSLAATALGPSSRLHRPTEPDSRRQPLPPHSTHQSHDYHHNHSHNRQQHNHHHDSGRYGAREQGGLHAQGQGPYGCVTASLDSPLLSLPLHTGAPERRRAGLQSATRRSLPLPIDPFAAASSYSTAAQPPSAVPAVPYLYDFQDDGQSDQDEEEYEVEDVLEPERHAGVGIGRSGAEGGGGGGGGGGGLAAGPGVLTSLQLQEWMSQHASRLLLPRHLHDIADLVFRPPSAVPLAEKRWDGGCTGGPRGRLGMAKPGGQASSVPSSQRTDQCCAFMFLPQPLLVAHSAQAKPCDALAPWLSLACRHHLHACPSLFFPSRPRLILPTFCFAPPQAVQAARHRRRGAGASSRAAGRPLPPAPRVTPGSRRLLPGPPAGLPGGRGPG